jgi:Uma2 family endonuclease
MTVTSAPTRFTPDDVLQLENEGLFELVDGQLVEKKTSSIASKTANRIAFHLSVWTQDFEKGEVFPEQTFHCFPNDGNLVRRPDVALILAERLGGVPDEGHVPISPDLAVEVISPNDKIYELDARLIDYRSAGVKLVWVVNPDSRTVRIHRLDHTVTELLETETLAGESLLAGFSVLVQELFPPPAGSP